MKISVYLSEEEKALVSKYAEDSNIKLSDYLRQRGLQKTIQSNKVKSTSASVACQLYSLSDTVEELSLREELYKLGGMIYGALED